MDYDIYIRHSALDQHSGIGHLPGSVGADSLGEAAAALGQAPRLWQLGWVDDSDEEGQAQDGDVEFLVLPMPGCRPARRITCHLLGG